MIANAFVEDQETHSCLIDEIERAERVYEEYSKTELDLFLESLPEEEHEPSSQYPFM